MAIVLKAESISRFYGQEEFRYLPCPPHHDSLAKTALSKLIPLNWQIFA